MSSALDYATARAKRHWHDSHSRALFAWVFRQIGAMRPARAVSICQHALGDCEKAHCQGEPAKIWRYDADGLTEVEAFPDLDRTSHIASTTPIIRFCLDESAARMIYTEWHSSLAGYGLTLRAKDGEWVPDRMAWKS